MSNENRTERVSSGVTALDNLDAETSGHVVESLVIRGDLSGLQPVDRARYYVSMCRGLGLNPASQPFEYLRLNGKDILYLKRGGSDQLAFIHRVNREVIDGPKIIDLAGTKLVYCVVRATLPNGRTETATATVPFVDPATVLMKVESKGKRRATLSILGLGLLDETEVESIPAHEKSETAQVSRADLADAMRALPATTNAPTLDAGARKVPDLAELDNVTGKTSPRPASQPPPAVEATAPTLDAQDIARVVERLKDARTLATVQEIVTQFSATADLASEAQKAEVRSAARAARAAIESWMREPPPDGIDPEPPTPPRGGRKNARAVPQTTEPASAPVESATAPANSTGATSTFAPRAGASADEVLALWRLHLAASANAWEAGTSWVKHEPSFAKEIHERALRLTREALVHHGERAPSSILATIRARRAKAATTATVRETERRAA